MQALSLVYPANYHTFKALYLVMNFVLLSYSNTVLAILVGCAGWVFQPEGVEWKAGRCTQY